MLLVCTPALPLYWLFSKPPQTPKTVGVPFCHLIFFARLEFGYGRGGGGPWKNQQRLSLSVCLSPLSFSLLSLSLSLSLSPDGRLTTLWNGFPQGRVVFHNNVLHGLSEVDRSHETHVTPERKDQDLGTKCNRWWLTEDIH